jgi:hypothetical protein
VNIRQMRVADLTQRRTNSSSRPTALLPRLQPGTFERPPRGSGTRRGRRPGPRRRQARARMLESGGERGAPEGTSFEAGGCRAWRFLVNERHAEQEPSRWLQRDVPVSLTPWSAPAPGESASGWRGPLSRPAHRPWQQLQPAE